MTFDRPFYFLSLFLSISVGDVFSIKNANVYFSATSINATIRSMLSDDKYLIWKLFCFQFNLCLIASKILLLKYGIMWGCSGFELQ